MNESTKKSAKPGIIDDGNYEIMFFTYASAYSYILIMLVSFNELYQKTSSLISADKI